MHIYLDELIAENEKNFIFLSVFLSSRFILFFVSVFVW